jgi:hypothetical protein
MDIRILQHLLLQNPLIHTLLQLRVILIHRILAPTPTRFQHLETDTLTERIQRAITITMMTTTRRKKVNTQLIQVTVTT